MQWLLSVNVLTFLKVSLLEEVTEEIDILQEFEVLRNHALDSFLQRLAKCLTINDPYCHIRATTVVFFEHLIINQALISNCVSNFE